MSSIFNSAWVQEDTDADPSSSPWTAGVELDGENCISSDVAQDSKPSTQRKPSAANAASVADLSFFERAVIGVSLVFWATVILMGVYLLFLRGRGGQWHSFWGLPEFLHNLGSASLLICAACAGIYFELREVLEPAGVDSVADETGLRSWCLPLCEQVLHTALFLCASCFLATGPWRRKGDALDLFVTFLGRALTVVGTLLAILRLGTRWCKHRLREREQRQEEESYTAVIEKDDHGNVDEDPLQGQTWNSYGRVR